MDVHKYTTFYIFLIHSFLPSVSNPHAVIHRLGVLFPCNGDVNYEERAAGRGAEVVIPSKSLVEAIEEARKLTITL
jgi:hypothetical protein